MNCASTPQASSNPAGLQRPGTSDWEQSRGAGERRPDAKRRRDTQTRSTWNDRAWLAQLCAEAGPDVLAAIDPDGVIRFVGGSVARLVGADADTVVGDVMWEFVHPDDLEAAAGAFNEATRTEGYHQPAVFRLRHCAGGWVECEMNGVTVDGPEGTWLILSLRTVADRDLVMGRRRQITRIVQQSSIACSHAQWADVDTVVKDALRQLANVVDADSIELAWSDAAGTDTLFTRAQWCRPGHAHATSESATEITDISAGRAPRFEPLWDPADTAASILQFTSNLALLDRTPIRDRYMAAGVRAAVELPLSPTEPWTICRLTFSDCWQNWDDVNVDVVLGLTRTLTATIQRCVAEEALRRQASTDSLTGLLNRIELYRMLDDFLSSPDTAAVTGVLYADLDQFKQVNDTYGHNAGDQVLRDVSSALRRSVRAVDLAARVGGDEFVVVCPDIDGDDHLAEIAARIRSAVRSVHTPYGPIDISIGSSMSGPGLGADDLIRMADESMYEHKRQRNPGDRSPSPLRPARPTFDHA